MKVLIVEDEQESSDKLCQLIAKHDPRIEILGTIKSASETIEWLTKNSHPDLIFMDVQLQDGSSFQIFDKVTITAPIIFTTSFNQYAIDAFKVNSIAYLLKPIEFGQLKGSLEKYRFYHTPDTQKILDEIRKGVEQVHSFKTRFISKVHDNIHMINAKDTCYFFAQFRGVYLMTAANKRFLVNYTLEQLEKELDPSKFFRLNRKFIGSIDFITAVTTFSSSRLKVDLKHCTERVLVPKEKVGAFKTWLES
ncbi:MAG: LytTR family DNA-binding domain-containing protein [Cyclobacteriaceae bacterium]